MKPYFKFSGYLHPEFIIAMCDEWRSFEMKQTKQIELFSDEEIYECFYSYMGYSI